jgi:sortase B
MYEESKAMNKDMIGWVYMPGYEKSIDYPVMQAEDNTYYLTRDFFKNNAYCGSIFIDASNDSDTVDRNIILYGHAMRDLSMFGNLMDYPDKEQEYKNNTKICLDLLNTRLEYEVFSTYYAEASFNYRQIRFAGDEEYQNFLDQICSKSFYDYNIVPGAGDKILTLSTCNGYTGKGDRTVIHARNIRQTLFAENPAASPEDAPQKNLEAPAPKDIISANTFLKQLELQCIRSDPANYEKVMFDTDFNTAFKFYNAVLPADAASCRLLCETDDPKAAIDVTIDDLPADPGCLIIPKGVHVIKVSVTSQDKKYIRIYSISVTKTGR